MARLHTGRHKVLATYRSYHGATAGAITLTGDPRRWPSETGGRSPASCTSGVRTRTARPSTPTARSRSASGPWPHLRDIVMVEGADTIAAIILETVVGTNGILVPPPGYLAGVAQICDENGILLIADEVMAGFGRCGEWFAVDHWGITPDLITFAKGVNSGYVPLGGVIISDAIADTFQTRPYPGGLTYTGHPLACATAVASITIFARRGHPRATPAPSARTSSDPGCAELADRHPIGRRRPRAGRVLGGRARAGPGDPRAAGAVQRRRRRGQADERVRRRLQGAGPVAVHPLQPHPRGAAVHRHCC